MNLDDPRNEAALRPMVLPLISRHIDGRWTAIGTAFVLYASDREALVVTAAHCVSQFVDRGRVNLSMPRIFQPPPPPVTHVKEHKLQVLAFADGQHAFADVSAARLHEHCDLAILQVRLTDESTVRFHHHIALDSTPLAPSAVVYVAGYAPMAVSQLGDKTFDDKFDIFDIPLRVHRGTVVHVENDDPRGYQIAQTSFAISSGMSGGPVFDVRGCIPYVRAVARSSFDFYSENLEPGGSARSRVSLVWPILKFPLPTVDGTPADEDATPPREVADLVRDGMLVDAGDGISHVTETEDGLAWRE